MQDFLSQKFLRLNQTRPWVGTVPVPLPSSTSLVASLVGTVSLCSTVYARGAMVHTPPYLEYKLVV